MARPRRKRNRQCVQARSTIGISSSEKNYDFQESITLEPLGGQTKVEFTMGFEPTVWWATALSVLVVRFQGPTIGAAAKERTRIIANGRRIRTIPSCKAVDLAVQEPTRV